MANKSFVMYDSWTEMVEDLTDEEAGRLLKAIYAYRQDRTHKPDDRSLRPVFNILKQRFEEDDEAYQEKVAKRAEASRKANGIKRKQSESNGVNRSQSESNGANRNQMETDTDTEFDTDTDTVTDIGTDIGTDTITDPSFVPSPAPQIAPQSPAPRLTSEERERLLAKGLPSRYVDERCARATEYAAKNGVNVYDVLMEWWKTDRQRAPWNTSQSEHGRAAGARFDSFDTDDFFQAALRKSFAMP